MVEYSATDDAVRLPHPAHCPPWCTECCHDNEPPGALLHHGPADTVGIYGESCELVDANIRTAFWDKPAQWIGTDPADLERPHVEVSIAAWRDVQVYLSPGQARTLAAALVQAAATADTSDAERPTSPGQ